MTFYRYKIIMDNSIFIGTIHSANAIEAINVVKNISKDLIYISKIWLPIRLRRRNHIMEWFNELNLLLREGVKVEDALTILAEKHVFSKSMLKLIHCGFSFSNAFAKHSFFFDKASVNMINTLVDCLTIEEAVSFIYNYHKYLQKRSNEFVGVLIMPLMTLIISLLTLVGLVYFIKEPVQNAMLSASIPPPDFFNLIDSMNYFDLLKIPILLLPLIYVIFKNREHIPVLGRYYKEVDFFISFYSIGSVMKNGMHVLNAISLVGSMTITSYMKNILNKIHTDLLQGKTLNSSLLDIKIKSTYINVIKIHELAGNLADGFLKSSNIANAYLDNYFNYLSIITGPLITMLTTTFVILFLQSVLFPIYTSFLSFGF